MNKLLVIAGPCVIESEENVMQMVIKEPSPDLLSSIAMQSKTNAWHLETE